MQMLNTIIRNERDRILVPVPQYPLYSVVISLFCGSLVPYYLEEEANWGLDFVDIRKIVAEARSKGITAQPATVQPLLLQLQDQHLHKHLLLKLKRYLQLRNLHLLLLLLLLLQQLQLLHR